jgi:hypothetical protein
MSHIHKTHNRFISFVGLITIAVFGIVSTLGSGGGGGDGDGGGVEPVTYTGLSTLALIDRDNALPLGEVAFLGVTAGTAITPVANVQSAPLAETRSASIITITRALHDAVNDIQVNSALSSLPVGWVETIPRTPGICGGFISGSLEVDESTEEVSGYILFEDYCEGFTTDPADGITMDGRVTFTGTCDSATFNNPPENCDLTDYIMTFTTFNVRGFGESETMTGTIASNITPTGFEATLNLLLREDNANVTYKFENYVITVTVDSPAGYDPVVVSGNVYHPAYGYVIVSTPTPVLFYTDMLDSPPLSGVVLLTGANGTAGGPTTARFTFVDVNSFTAAVDENGDGVTFVTWSCDWDGNCSMI